MRILFSTTPAHGHLLPLLPLARAFRERGAEVAVITAGAFAPVLAPEGIALLPAGPTADVLFAEVARRTGGDPAADPTPEGVAEFFAGTRVDLSADEALEAAKGWRPDLVVSELCDFVGPLVAAALDVPVATLAFGPALPPEFGAGMAAVVASRYADRGLTPRPSTWYLDTCPPALQGDAWQAPAGQVALRPEAHRHPWQETTTGTEAARDGRQRVLVSFGTYFSAPEVLSPLLRALSAADVDLRVTLGLTATAEDFDVDHDRVTFVGFTPLDELLRGVDLVVTHGGAGTTLGTLAAGIPLVVVPQGADQFIQAERVAAAGAGVALPPGAARPEAVAAAAAEVLAEPSYRTASAGIAGQIAAMGSPAEVAARLVADLEAGA